MPPPSPPSSPIRRWPPSPVEARARIPLPPLGKSDFRDQPVGKLVGHHAYHFEDHDLPDEEVLSSLLGRFHEDDWFVPTEVLLPFEIEGMEALAEYLTKLRERKVEVLAPRRGEKKRLFDLAAENAAHGFRERNDEASLREKMLVELQRKLGVASTPKRIECFDVSHVQGEAVVASMVAFDEGLPDKNGSRRYKLRGVQRDDDFAAMNAARLSRHGLRC